MINTDKKILDCTCGSRGIWFNKHHPDAVYCDQRKEMWESDYGTRTSHRVCDVNPDVPCDFRDLPFEDETFSLVVFDPPHVKNLSKDSWLAKLYGSLDEGWQDMIRDGYRECMRVLKPDGVLIFKWSDVSISTRDVINAIGHEPLFVHRSGKKMNTHWMCFMKGAQE